MRSGILPGDRNLGSFGSISELKFRLLLASSTNCGIVHSSFEARQVLRHSSSNHIPVTFFNIRTVLAAPSSFVRFAASACLEVTGTSLSIPTSYQVPLDM